MTLKADDLRGGAKKYEALPSSEKESIDRQFAEITRQVEAHEESKVSGFETLKQGLVREAVRDCQRIINGGVWSMPTKNGGNIIMEKELSEEDKELERIVRSIKYDLSVEQAVELLKQKRS